MAKVIWVGTIEISYLDHEDSDKRKNAFTVVTTWASSAEEFRQKCELMLESYGWKLLDIDKANPAPDNYDYNEEVADQLERIVHLPEWPGTSAITRLIGTFALFYCPRHGSGRSPHFRGRREAIATGQRHLLLGELVFF